MFGSGELLDAVQALMAGGVLSVFAHQLTKGLGQALPEWVKGRAAVAKIRAENRARIAELYVMHQLERDRSAHRELDRPRPPPSR